MGDLSAVLGLSVAMYTFAASVMLPKLSACSGKGIESLATGQEGDRKKEIRNAAIGTAAPLTAISIFQAYLCLWSLFSKIGGWSVEIGVLVVSSFIAVYVAALTINEDLQLLSAWKELTRYAAGRIAGSKKRGALK